MSDSISRLVPSTESGVGPVVTVLDGNNIGYVAGLLVAFGFKQGQKLPENMRGVWRRIVNCGGNVVVLQLAYHQEKQCYRLTAFGDFVKEASGADWCFGVVWSSNDGLEWGKPFMMWKVDQQKARPSFVGTTVATFIADADESGVSPCRPFILPYNGEQYDTRYCGFLNSFFPDGSLRVVKDENGKADEAKNHRYLDVEFPERSIGNGLVPLPAYKQRFDVIRFERKGQPRLLIKGSLVANMFSNADQPIIHEAAIGICLDEELLDKDGLGSWEIRTLPPRRLKNIDQVRADNVAEFVDESGEDEDADSSETTNQELDAVTAEG